jgi:large subunit ribosomal protein L6
MSRIGKLPIEIPAGVKFTVTDTNLVTVKGPLGELTQQVDPDITF